MDELRFGAARAWREVESAQADATKAILEDLFALDDAYDKLFSRQERTDALSSLFYQIEDDAEDAAEAVRRAAQSILDSQASLAEIGSERAKNEYWLQVAIDYGDLLRAQEIRAKLMELDAQEAKAQADLVSAQRDAAKAQDAQNKSLTDSTRQSIKNREIVQELLGVYTDYVSELIDSGASQSDVVRSVAESREAFLEQGQALGFSASELQTYAKVFDNYAGSTQSSASNAEKAVEDLYEAWQDYIIQLASSGASQKVIDAAIRNGKAEVTSYAREMGLAESKVKAFRDSFTGIATIFSKIPKNVNVKFDADTDPATAAIKEWVAKNTKGSTFTGAGVPGGGYKIPISTSFTKPSTNSTEMLQTVSKLAVKMAQIANYSKNPIGNYKKLNEAVSDVGILVKKLKAFDRGGFTGAGPKYQEAGIVHKGEYVFPKQAVNQSTGQPYLMEAVMQGAVAPRMPSVIMVELSPTDRALLKNSGASLSVNLDGKVLARAVNGSNVNSSIRGSN